MTDTAFRVSVREAITTIKDLMAQNKLAGIAVSILPTEGQPKQYVVRAEARYRLSLYGMAHLAALSLGYGMLVAMQIPPPETLPPVANSSETV